MGDDTNISTIIDNMPRFLNFFVVGYFVLFVVYDKTFLNYDIYTRAILSISASLLLSLVPDILAGIIMKFWGHDLGRKSDPNMLVGHSFFIISLFTIFEWFYDFDITLRQNPELFLIVVILIAVFHMLWYIGKIIRSS